MGVFFNQTELQAKNVTVLLPTIMDKSLGTLLHFRRRFPIHTGPTPPITMLDACIQNFLPRFNFI